MILYRLKTNFYFITLRINLKIYQSNLYVFIVILARRNKKIKCYFENE